jgi:hypothetical protein
LLEHSQRNNLISSIKDKLNEPIRWDRVQFTGAYLAFIIIDQLIEGSALFPSLIGIQLYRFFKYSCSFNYWFVFAVYIVTMIAAFRLAVNTVLRDYEARIAICNSFNDKKIEFIKNNMKYLIWYSIYGGTIASMVGIGGGLVVAPIMFSFNAEPKVN